MSDQEDPEKSQPQQSRKAQVITEEKIGEDEYSISIKLPDIEDDEEDDSFLFLGLTEEELEYNLSLGTDETSEFPYKQDPTEKSKENEVDKSVSEELHDLPKKDAANKAAKERTDSGESEENERLKKNCIDNTPDRTDSESCCSERLNQESPSSLDEEEWFVSRKCNTEIEEDSIEDAETEMCLPENTSIT